METNPIVGKLEFQLPEAQSELNLALNAGKWQCVVWELDNFLRNKLKYEELSKEADDAYSTTRTQLHDLLDEFQISLD